MEWKNLSDEAKGVIEWVVTPVTNWKQTIKIKIGEVFHREYPKFCGNYEETLSDINILITPKLYQEILEYISKDENMEYEKSVDGLIFRLKGIQEYHY